jgi:hypothetical protein
MQISWGSSRPNASYFRKMFPRGGYCLVGRAHLEHRDTSITDILSRAVRTMLHEGLSLNDARRLVVAGPSRLINSQDTNEFVGNAAIATKDEVLTVQTLGSRQAATILAFGITPSKPTRTGFEYFCTELLKSAGWTVHRARRQFEVTHASYGDESREAAFVFLERKGSLDKTLKLLDEDRSHMRVVLTNFAAPANLARHLNAQGIWIFHYSLLGYFADIFRTRVPQPVVGNLRKARLARRMG